MNRSGSESTSVLISPRPMVPPASSKRADSSRSSGRPLTEIARIVSRAPKRSYLSGTNQRTAQSDFTPIGSPASPLNLLYFRDFGRLDYRRIQEAADGRAGKTGKSADVPGADGASPQDRSRLQVLARTARGAPGNPAARALARAGLQQVPRHER